MRELFSYAGKRVAIVGCASGMGETCARTLVELGAEVHGADIRPSPVKLTVRRQRQWHRFEVVI